MYPPTLLSHFCLIFLSIHFVFFFWFFKFPAFFQRFMRETFVATWMHWKPLIIEDISVKITALVTSIGYFSICILSQIYNRNIDAFYRDHSFAEVFISVKITALVTSIWSFSIYILSQIYIIDSIIIRAFTYVSWSFICRKVLRLSLWR